jgi:hypothetical protein
MRKFPKYVFFCQLFSYIPQREEIDSDHLLKFFHRLLHLKMSLIYLKEAQTDVLAVIQGPIT